MGLIETAVTRWHRWIQQSSNATTPASGYWNLFFKAGGLYTINNAGTVIAHGGGAITTLNIASGAITITGKHHFVDTEASAASDNLDTISGGYEGQELFIQAFAGARTVVIRHGIDNIRTPSGFDVTLDETYKVAHLVFDDSFWNLVGESAIYPNNLSAWGDPPDGTLKFAGQYTDDTLWHFTGNEMRSPIPYTFTTSTSFALSAYDFILIDSATDRAITTTGTPARGWKLFANALQVSGGTGHTLKLPAGVTYDGTNNTATFNATTDVLEALAISTTRYLLTNNTTGVTFSVT